MRSIRVVAIAACIAFCSVTAGWAGAPTGAKALFYGSSGASMQPTASPGMSGMPGNPAMPGSTLGSGFPTSPPASPAASGGTPGAMPAAAPGSPAEDLTKIADDLVASASALPPLKTPTAALSSPAPSATADTGSGTPLPSNGPPGPTLGSSPPTPSTAIAGAPPEGKDLEVADDHMGVKYWVELADASGRSRRITTDYVFRAGDRIRLHVVSNRDGYLTLVNLGTSGQTTVLFPQESVGGSNFIRAGGEQVVPSSGYLRFDQTPGQEVVILTFSPRPTSLAPTAAAAMTMAAGAKDLIQEVDASSPQPASYAVAPVRPNGGAIALQIKLTHGS